jgi:hypothetical protein
MAKAASRGPLPIMLLRWATAGWIDDAAPIIGAWLKGGLIGLGISLAGAALSHQIRNSLQYFAMLLEVMFRYYPIAGAGVLIGGAIGLVWSRRHEDG